MTLFLHSLKEGETKDHHYGVGSKTSPATLASHRGECVNLAALLLIQRPIIGPGKATEDGSTTWALATHMKDLD